MFKLLDILTDQNWRYRMGQRFEAFTNEVFQVVRWVLVVGFADYISRANPSLILDVVYWALSALLFTYLASRFLLRPEIQLMPDPNKRWQRLVQSALNFILCVVVFGVVLWAVTQMSASIANYRTQSFTSGQI